MDRLTNLPDELLIRIISLLPTKDAAATSILSRRLRRSIFPLITTLDFDVSPILSLCLQHPYKIELYPTFVTFVDNVLQAHQSRYLTKFRLKVSSGDFGTVYFYGCYGGGCITQGCLPDLEPLRLNAWISYPLTLSGLRELDLCILVREPGDSQLPCAIFTCETLEVLKLEVNIGLDHVVSMPSYRLPNLKLLCLSAFFISDDTFLPRLVSSCPVLEDLTFEPVANNVNIAAITSTSLRKLSLHLHKSYVSTGANSDLVLIDTPNLEFLYYSDHLAKCYSIPVMQCLVKAILVTSQILEFDDLQVSFQQVINLISPFSCVQHLVLSGYSLREFDWGDEKLVKEQLPVFTNLKHLELIAAAQNKYWDKLVLPFLNCSPVLEILEVTEGFIDDVILDSSNKEELKLDHEVPICCRFHLRKIVVKNYHNLANEVGMIRFLLRHALVLEEVVICLPREEGPFPDQMLVENTFKDSPRASLTCSIQVLC